MISLFFLLVPDFFLHSSFHTQAQAYTALMPQTQKVLKHYVQSQVQISEYTIGRIHPGVLYFLGINPNSFLSKAIRYKYNTRPLAFISQPHLFLKNGMETIPQTAANQFRAREIKTDTGIQILEKISGSQYPANPSSDLNSLLNNAAGHSPTKLVVNMFELPYLIRPLKDALEKSSGKTEILVAYDSKFISEEALSARLLEQGIPKEKFELAPQPIEKGKFDLENLIHNSRLKESGYSVTVLNGFDLWMNINEEIHQILFSIEDSQILRWMNLIEGKDSNEIQLDQTAFTNQFVSIAQSVTSELTRNLTFQINQ